jgi:type I restriction enzyme, S subunit
MRIPLAPFNEQKRIVAKIEELLARVNATRERLAKVPVILKRFRQAVLAAACSGQLTEDWRKTHPNVARTTTAVSVSVDNNGLPALPEGWVWKRIDKLASRLPRSIQSGPFGSNLLHSEFKKEGILVIGIDNVMDGKFSMGKEHRISKTKYKELEKYKARPLDVLITVMATVGRCCVVPEDIETAIITKHVYRITSDNALVKPHYLMYSLLGDPTVQDQIQNQIIGQTRPGINGKILRGISIATPPVLEQEEILRRIEALLRLGEKIKVRVAAGMKRVEQLTDAILMKAFYGELVPTEAELARAQSRSYESARDLLEQIRRQRQILTETHRKGEAATMARRAKVFKPSGRRQLISVLTETKKRLTPDELLRQAGFDEDSIEDFYEELRAGIAGGKIVEKRPNTTEVYLEATAS